MTSKNNKKLVACKNSYLCLLFAARCISPGEMSSPQPQKFHTCHKYGISVAEAKTLLVTYINGYIINSVVKQFKK